MLAVGFFRGLRIGFRIAYCREVASLENLWIVGELLGRFFQFCRLRWPALRICVMTVFFVSCFLAAVVRYLRWL